MEDKERKPYIIYTNAEGQKTIEDALDAEVIRLTKGRKVKQYTEEELAEKKKRTDEDYKKIAEMLNRKYKNPERAIARKQKGVQKFGKSIVKRLNKKK